MQVILKQDVSNLGNKDEMVNVKDGYARNFLIPRKLGIPATASAIKMLAETTKQRAHKEAKLREEALASAKKLQNVKLSVGAKASSTGKIFGSVNNIQIAESLIAQGYNIDRKSISIKEATIKEVGSYKAKIKLYKDIDVEIDFDVVAE